MSKRKTPSDEVLIRERKIGLSGSDIGKKYKVSKVCVCRHLKRLGIEKESPIGKKGKDHSQWKGGRHIKYGYIKIWMPSHTRANNIGYVSEHVLVAERMYERPIKKSEHVHHIDFTRDNNNPENLWVADNRDHHIAERSIQRLVKPLLEKGIIKFNREKGVYEL